MNRLSKHELSGRCGRIYLLGKTDEVGSFLLNLDDALDNLLRVELTAKYGTSSKFASHRKRATIPRQNYCGAPYFIAISSLITKTQ